MTSVDSLFKTQSQANERTVGNQLQSIPMIVVISLLLFCGIGWRLSYLQLQQGTINQLKAEDNRTRIVPKPPVRGTILDRKGRILATNRLSYSAYLWPKAQKEENWAKIRNILADILDTPPQELQKRVEEAGYNYPSLIPIARNLTPAQITAIEEYHLQLKWIEIDAGKIRDYPQGKLAAHILGYTVMSWVSWEWNLLMNRN
jgi:penicillin-binding protein 2